MTRIFRSLQYSLVLAIIYSSVVSGTPTPSTNVAVILETEEKALPGLEMMIFSSLVKEMRLSGFMGRIRVVDAGEKEISNGETMVKITITKNRWLTKKLLSIPYFLNRYRREYVLESHVEIPEGKNGMSVKRITAVSYAPAVAQYINNDRYDPALFPTQTEVLEMKENAGRELAKKLTAHLLNQLR